MRSREARSIGSTLLLLAAVLASAASAGALRASAVIPVPSNQLISSGKLSFCTDFPAPPQEMYTTSGKPEGSDIDTGNAIAAQFGLKPVYVNTNFDTIIEALTTGKCDLIITGIFITPERQKQIDFVPYFTSGQSLLVRKGNPQHITDSYTSMCGKTIATQIGDVELTTAQTFSKQCKKAGKPAINILSSTKVDTALQQVTTNRAAAFFYDSPLIAYYSHLQPTEFQAAAPPIGVVLEGVGVTKSHKVLEHDVVLALKRIEANGTYTKILAKWGLQKTKIPKP
jgi:polar amino acid transport system substrate-binding protein